ncbi:MAG: DnaD domain-containing protein [Enterococcus gilvus]|uniref:DnaD domain protein n=1 Tax=Enterococcus gilvus TaxID=160453 RepID=UPI0039F4EAB8
MDYIRQINAFENLNEFNDIGPGAQLLWYKLMRVANLSGWQKELSISNTRLQSMTKTSEKTLINNRNQLIQNGLLQYKKRGRTKAGIYILSDITGNFTVKTPADNTATGNIPVNSSVDSSVDSSVNSSVDSSVDSSVNSSVVSSVDTSAYINNTIQNKTKDNHHDVSPLQLANNHWGKNRAMNSVLQDAILQWCNTWENELVAYALDLAYKNSVSMNGVKPYVNKILTNWKKDGIDSLEKAKAQSKPQSNQKAYSNKRVENLPEHIAHPMTEAEASEKARQELINLGVTIND